MGKELNTGLRLLCIMTIITGLLYPGLITAFASLFFSSQAHGSLIKKNETIIGSSLIGQNFTSQKYFWSRPSVIEYNPLPSGASNLGPMNPLLKEAIVKRKNDFERSNHLSDESNVPPEMLTASASGLDPDISPEAAILQVERVANARGLDQKKKTGLVNLIREMTEERQFSILGEPRINVFLLNLKTDRLYGH